MYDCQVAGVKISPGTPTVKQATYQPKTVVKSPAAAAAAAAGAAGSSQQIKVAAVTPQGVTRIVSGGGTPVRVSTAQTGQLVLGAGGAAGTPRFVHVKTGASPAGVPVKLGAGNVPVKLAGNAVPLKIGAANIQGKLGTTAVQKVGGNVPLKIGAGNVKIGTSNVLVKTAGGAPVQAKVGAGVPVKLGAGNLPVIASGGQQIQIAGTALQGQQVNTYFYKLIIL